ncbi:methionine biosynthesis protein MetW [Patescibacteria group bacterium]|nr:methionine biosynthesis protein MetW [Patescibacteria group bacterium]MBU4057346.1 methionine biosynthesis protein MetW [Patescibacteria group bacterium]MBU4115790.1 methionine biosynthesis protein MetW [Patescibacteria group bacterium]
MSVEKFENEKWKGKDQQIVFRHKMALKMIGSGRVLDIGCGDGLFLEMLKNVTSEGVDISEEGIKKCIEKGLNVFLCDFSKDRLPFSDNEFDYVVMLDVLEHLYVPEELLKEAIRVSKKYVIISVPNFSSLPARVQTLFGGVPENNRPKKGHVYWFNLKILEEMLKNNDLKIVDIKMNSFWGLNFLTRIFPSLFALSFILRMEKSIV